MPLSPTEVGQNPQQPGVSAELFNPDQLIAGDLKVVSKNITVSAGTLARGTVMGRKTADGEYIISVVGAGDGSEVPAGVLADDVDASGGAVNAGLYVMGQFNQNKIAYDATWGGSLAVAVAALNVHLEPRGVYLKPAESAADPT